VPSLTAAGVSAAAARAIVPPRPGRALWPLGVAGAAGLVTFAFTGVFGRRRRSVVREGVVGGIA
jgi:hypothetical protein